MYEIYRSESTQKFHFRLKAANGEIILTGQGYQDKSGCNNGIESVKKNAGNEDAFEVKEAKDGRQYFVLKAANGQVIGQSQMYKSETGLKNGMASVAKNCHGDTNDTTA